jgi:cobalt-zinc-cadmium efflux system outer membrane protein
VSSRNLWTLAVAGALGMAVASAAAEPISLDAAIRRAMESNPTLRAEAASVEALEHQARLDGLRPAPTIGAELENVGGTGSVSGVHGAEATLRLGQVVELGGKQAARRERGDAAIALQANVIAQKRLDIATEATKRYIAIVEAQEELALTTRQVALAGEIQAAVQQRVDRGVAPEGDVALAEIVVARAELAREHAEHERASAQFSLASLWGTTSLVEVQAEGNLLDVSSLPEFEALALRLTATPEAESFTRELDRIEADRGVARAGAKPDLAFSAGVRRLEALDDQALVFSFSMPFGTAERSAHAVARTESELDAVAARRDAALLEARQVLFARYQELRHAQTEYTVLTERMIPAAERGLRLTRAGYDDARYSILQLTQVQSTLLQLQLDRLAAATRYHTLLADIERSTAAAGATP